MGIYVCPCHRVINRPSSTSHTVPLMVTLPYSIAGYLHHHGCDPVCDCYYLPPPDTNYPTLSSSPATITLPLHTHDHHLPPSFLRTLSSAEGQHQLSLGRSLRPALNSSGDRAKVGFCHILRLLWSPSSPLPSLAYPQSP